MMLEHVTLRVCAAPESVVSPRLLAGLLCVLVGSACSSSGKPDRADSGTSGVPTPTVRPERAVFPSADLIVGGSLHLDRANLPVAAGGTPLPTERLRWRSGLSPVQTVVFDLHEAVDPASLPTAAAAQADGAVQLWDLDTGVALPCFAELDAHPEAERPQLIVRPLVPLPVGHDVAVLLTDELRATDGSPWTGPDWYAAAADGRAPETPSGEALPHYAELDDLLDEFGAPARSQAERLPIDDGAAPLRAMLAGLETPTTWSLDTVLDADLDEGLPAGTWRQAQGSFATTTWLVDDGMFDGDSLDPSTGAPAAQGTTEASLFVFVPESVRGAAPGTVPVWLFGHGIFSSPESYLAEEDDPSAVIDLANEAGAIVVATRWRGLTRADLPVAIGVATDFGTLPHLTDKLAQGVANTAALAHLVQDGDLLDAPVFGGLADPETLRWYGISLGGIQGATLLALDQTIEHGVLHVGGGAWSTMLERSSNWSQFELLLQGTVPDPADRQLLYAASQLFWDVADPALHTDALADRSVLWQEATGDEQVPNLTTGLMARGAGAALVVPAAREVPGLAPLADSRTVPALATFDPQLGLPATTNRPAAVSGAHSTPRRWDTTAAQTLRFLDAEDPGVVIHPCGAAPCTAAATTPAR